MDKLYLQTCERDSLPSHPQDHEQSGDQRHEPRRRGGVHPGQEEVGEEPEHP